MAVTSAVSDFFGFFYELIASAFNAVFSLFHAVFSLITGTLSAATNLVTSLVSKLTDIVSGVVGFVLGNMFILAIGGIAVFAFVTYTRSGRQMVGAADRKTK